VPCPLFVTHNRTTFSLSKKTQSQHRSSQAQQSTQPYNNQQPTQQPFLKQ
jgi:hypothetical protein